VEQVQPANQRNEDDIIDIIGLDGPIAGSEPAHDELLYLPVVFFDENDQEEHKNSAQHGSARKRRASPVSE
jgi:hypothetical protein